MNLVLSSIRGANAEDLLGHLCTGSSLYFCTLGTIPFFVCEFIGFANGELPFWRMGLRFCKAVQSQLDWSDAMLSSGDFLMGNQCYDLNDYLSLVICPWFFHFVDYDLFRLGFVCKVDSFSLVCPWNVMSPAIKLVTKFEAAFGITFEARCSFWEMFRMLCYFDSA